eukprot:jgi/Mesvir1/12994/Mv06002-RA.3
MSRPPDPRRLLKCQFRDRHCRCPARGLTEANPSMPNVNILQTVGGVLFCAAHADRKRRKEEARLKSTTAQRAGERGAPGQSMPSAPSAPGPHGGDGGDAPMASSGPSSASCGEVPGSRAAASTVHPGAGEGNVFRLASLPHAWDAGRAAEQGNAEPGAAAPSHQVNWHVKSAGTQSAASQLPRQMQASRPPNGLAGGTLPGHWRPDYQGSVEGRRLDLMAQAGHWNRGAVRDAQRAFAGSGVQPSARTDELERQLLEARGTLKRKEEVISKTLLVVVEELQRSQARAAAAEQALAATVADQTAEKLRTTAEELQRLQARVAAVEQGLLGKDGELATRAAELGRQLEGTRGMLKEHSRGRHEAEASTAVAEEALAAKEAELSSFQARAVAAEKALAAREAELTGFQARATTLEQALAGKEGELSGYRDLAAELERQLQGARKTNKEFLEMRDATMKGRTPLILAADRGDLDAVRRYVEGGADVNASDKETDRCTSRRPKAFLILSASWSRTVRM